MFLIALNLETEKIQPNNPHKESNMKTLLCTCMLLLASISYSAAPAAPAAPKRNTSPVHKITNMTEHTIKFEIHFDGEEGVEKQDVYIAPGETIEVKTPMYQLNFPDREGVYKPYHVENDLVLRPFPQGRALWGTEEGPNPDLDDVALQFDAMDI